MVKLVIFDLDETLLRLPVDWPAVKKEVIEYGRKEGVQFDETLHIIPLSSAISNTEKRKEEADSIWRKHELRALDEKGVERYSKSEQFLKNLKSKNMVLAIASNNCHATIEKALSLADILQYFDLIVGRDDVRHTKPAPDMLLKISDYFKIQKEDALFIGDSENDRKAGESAKINTLMIKPNSDFPEVK